MYSFFDETCYSLSWPRKPGRPLVHSQLREVASSFTRPLGAGIGCRCIHLLPGLAPSFNGALTPLISSLRSADHRGRRVVNGSRCERRFTISNTSIDWARRLVCWIDYPGIQYFIMLSLDNDCIAVAFQEYIQPGIHEPRERSNCFSLLSNEKHKQPFIPKREDKAKNLRAELLVLFC